MPFRSSESHPFRVAWAAVDGLIWVGAVLFATWMRFDFHLEQIIHPKTILAGIGIALVHVVLGFLTGPYSVGHMRASFEESVDLFRTVAITAAIAMLATWWTAPRLIPRSVPLSAATLALALMLAARYLVRAYKQRQLVESGEGRRTIVFGAGSGGTLLLTAMVRDKDSGFVPVALLDDEPAKARLSIEGVRVRGTRDDLAEVAKKYEADTLAIAVPSADADLIRDLRERARDAGLATVVLPPAADLIGRSTTSALRDVSLADLLGRRPIRLDQQLIARSLEGKRILVTGAGGSIGSELCRQISKFNPAALIMLDRDESGLHATQLTIDGNGLLDAGDTALCDIRDLDAVRRIFAETKPDMIFHAAALKHLPLLETYPFEAWKSNVLGTQNVLTAAEEIGVETVVNISTDKAADPTCVLGYSKRVAERITADYARTSPARYVSVRFGNVLGSRGSVIHAFTSQIQAGGPVTVTHPDVERFFMLIPEACQLVLEAAAIGPDGVVMVLDMGSPMKIVDVAKTLIDLSGRSDVEITFTGLRPGEKMSEDLFSGLDDIHKTEHELVSYVEVPPITQAELHAADPVDHASAKVLMERLALESVNRKATAVDATEPKVAP